MTEYTAQQFIALFTLHHRTQEKPLWSGDPYKWPVCTVCSHDIFTTGDSESGPLWACSDPECEMA